MRKRYKALLLVLLPVVVIVGGALLEVPYSGSVGLIIILFYILLGIFYGTDRFKNT